MGRSKITPILQPDDLTCGPTSLKTALSVFGVRKSVPYLARLCRTNRNGTSTRNLIAAANKLGFSVQTVTNATLKHLQSALKTTPKCERAVVVSYLSETDGREKPDSESGHWAAVASYKSATARIVLFDSASGQKRSVSWSEFLTQWTDYDLTRRRNKRSFMLVRRWQPRLLLTIARNPDDLPKFTTDKMRIYPAPRTSARLRA